MGRELKRVPMDFAWKLGMAWPGYLNPYESRTCPFCEGTGYNKEMKKLYDSWYGKGEAEWVDLPNGRRYNRKAWCYSVTQDEVQALLDAGRLREFPMAPGSVPTAEEVNEWSKNSFGINDVDICIQARAKRLGLEYGLCEHCKGEGRVWKTPEEKELSDKWEREDPPTGEGFQMWENTSEGSPKSPVFVTLEELCDWLEESKTSVFGKETATASEWKGILTEGKPCFEDGRYVFL